MKRVVAITFLLGLSVAGSASANQPGANPSGPPGPPPDAAGRGGATTQSSPNPIFAPPAGATYDPSTRGDPGVVTGSVQGPSDQSYGAPDRGDGAGGVVSGYDITDTGMYSVDSGYDAVMPDFHLVVTGDTLWDICSYYFRDAYLWPKIWSYNEQITNAHWIFPGDRVRLTDPYGRDDSQREAEIPLSYSETYKPPTVDTSAYMLNRYAYIDEEQLEKDMTVVGGSQAKVMMSTLDTAYIDYKPENPPIAGERLSVYRPKIPIHDIKVKGKKKTRVRKGERIGWLVEVVGEVYVQSIAKKTAETTVVDALRPVERGQRVGDLKTRFSRINPTESEVTDNGLVVHAIRDLALNGEEQFVVTNLGATHGVRRGNVLEVVRKGDEYSPDHRFKIPYEDGWPRRVLGTILVIQVEEATSLGVVTFSRREIQRGDHIEIRSRGMSESDQPRTGSWTAEGDANVSAGQGEAKGSAGFKLGK